MALADLLAEHRSQVLDRWRALTLATYPGGSGQLFANERDPFKNPVGATVRLQSQVILDGLLGASDEADVRSAVDILVQMRAVQEFTPAQAVGFVFLLKRALREELGEGLDSETLRELLRLETLVDNLALTAFDVFVRCRERVFEIRAREAKARVHSLLRQAEMVVDLDSEGGEPRPSSGKGG